MTTRLKSEVVRFVIVGSLTVGIDFVVYVFLLAIGVSVTPGKTVSFLLGGLFAYFANRHFTFRATGRHRLLLCYAIYAVTLGVNVLVNLAVLALFGRDLIGIVIAFVIATSVSATLNFIGLRSFVFHADQPTAAAP